MSSRSAEPDRPPPEAFLRAAAEEGRGKLKLFLGAAPGVGKTYEMLQDGAERRRAGVDVVVAVVETHGRAETEALVHGHEVVPRREIDYQNRLLTEMDLDAVLARKPGLALVDELAHSNAPGSRHPKRHQDVAELLATGIDVYSTLNVQHIESLNDVVASFTRVRVRETVPDSVLETAEIEIVDIPPDELIERLKAGKVYVPDEASRALTHFFSKSNLSALRELALRRAAQAVDAQMLDHVRAQALAGNFAAGERLIVAVSELPGADALVRAAKRQADALKAAWTAVHIETPRTARFTPDERARLADTLRLAAELGATTASVPAESVFDGLVAYTDEARATQLVIGKSVRSRWFEWRHGSIVDRLVRRLDNMIVHVIPARDQRAAPPRPRASTSAGWGPPAGYGVALGLVALVTLVAKLLQPLLPPASVDLLYLIPVMSAATLHGLRPGLVAGLASALAFNFFFLPPTWTFTISDPANVVTVVVLLGVAFLTSQLAARVGDRAALAARSARQNAALAAFSRALTAVASEEELARTACAEAARMFGASAALLLPGRDGPVLRGASPPIEGLGHLELAAARWALEKGEAAGRGSATLPAADWVFHPLRTGRGVLGVLGLAGDDGRDPVRADQLQLLGSLLDQAALSLDRVRLEDDMRRVSQLEERDRLRGALLSSVGHDLRSPLTAVLASIDEVRGQLRADAPGDAIDRLDGEARRLQRFVSNLLDMARVEAGALRVAREPTDLTDAVAGAVHDLRAALRDHKVILDVPPDLPLVRVDPQLLHHCLINLIDNASRHGGEAAPITLRARRTPDGVDLAVLDEGPGLPPGVAARIFDTFARAEGSDRKGGAGLGLAIVKGFAEAMDLTVSAANRADGTGAAFTLHIPARLLVPLGEIEAAA